MEQKKVFNLSLALMSLLNGYAFVFMRGFSLAMIITTVYALIGVGKNFVYNTRIKVGHFLMFWIYAVCQTMISLAIVESIDYGRVVYIALKILIWAAFISFCEAWFDYSLLIKYMKNIILITFVYLIIQYVCNYIFNIAVPCSFDFGIIKASHEAYEYQLDSTVFRPGSFWLEPGYLGYYYNSFLAICLFDKKRVEKIFRNSRRYTLITCIGIILSGSTGAMGIMVILLLIRLIIKDRRQAILSIAFLSAIIFIFYFAIKYNWIEALKGYNASLDNTIWKLQNLDKVGRIGQSFELLDLLNGANKLLGLGLGNELNTTNGLYMNGMVTIVYWLGYVGLAIWILMFLSLNNSFCTTIVQKVMLFVLLFNGVFSGLYFGTHSFIYLLVALYRPNFKQERIT